jgi:hypothetical protein
MGGNHRQAGLLTVAASLLEEQTMSIFGNIMSKIFGGGAQAASAGATAPSTSTQAGAGSTTAASTSATRGSSSGQTVDVEAVLKDMASKSGQKLDYRRSIVDLMKLLDLDSSLTARKELAKELNYTGDTNDSATMNVWLHKQVMRKLAENGGKVPDDLKD